VRQVEIDHLKTTIIALHEEFKVVEDERKDADTNREKETLHQAQGTEVIGRFIDGTLTKQAQDEEEKNRKYEEMLVKENTELQDEVQ
jgi:hypothetical protein